MSTVSSSPIAACLSLTRAISRAASPEDIYTRRPRRARAGADGHARGGAALRSRRRHALQGLARSVGACIATPSRATRRGRPTRRTRSRSSSATSRRDRSLDALSQRRSSPRASRALAFIPLVSAGRVIGKFMLYYDAPRDAERRGAAARRNDRRAGRVRAGADSEPKQRSRVNEERLRFALDAAAHGHLGARSRRPRLVTLVGAASNGSTATSPAPSTTASTPTSTSFTTTTATAC